MVYIALRRIINFITSIITTTKNAKEIGFFKWKKSVFEIFKTDIFLSVLEKKCKRHRFLTDVKQEKRNRFYLKLI